MGVPRSSTGRRRRTSFGWSAIALMVLATTSPSVAQAHGTKDGHAIVLRSMAPETRDVAAWVDGALVAALERWAAHAELTLSPVPLTDIELAAGCEERTAACLGKIAQNVGADVLIVRELRPKTDGVELAIVSYERAKKAGPNEVVVAVGSNAGETSRIVEHAVKRLYHVPGAVAAAEREEKLDLRSTRLQRSGWSLVATGGAMLATGVAMAFLAEEARKDYARLGAGTPREAELARDMLDRADRRSIASTAMLAVGGLFATSGLGLLVYRAVSADEKQSSAFDLHVQPALNGARVTLRGTFRGP